MKNDEEPMALIRWDFTDPIDNYRGRKGAITAKTKSIAEDAVKSLNAVYGEGTHFVEVLSETWDSHLLNQ